MTTKNKPPPRQPYNDYKSNCRRKNIYWELEFDDFIRLISQNCHYCDRPPTNVRAEYKCNGLDRIDNEKGYTLKNVVTCCYPCNRVKSDQFNQDEMQELGKIIKKFWEKKGQKPGV